MSFAQLLAKNLGEKPRHKLIGLIGATVEVIAACRSHVVEHPLDKDERGPLVDGLRQLGACAYQLAAELEDEKQKGGKCGS